MRFALGTLQHQWRTKTKSIHYPPALTTDSSTTARGTYSTPPTHVPTHPLCTPNRHVQQHISIHAQFVAVSYWGFHVFMLPRHNEDRARPSPGVPFHAPRAPWPPALCFKVLFSPLLLCVYSSQAEFLVVSPPLSLVSCPRTL